MGLTRQALSRDGGKNEGEDYDSGTKAVWVELNAAFAVSRES